MKLTNNDPLLVTVLQQILAQQPLVQKIITDIITHRGQVLLVGGAVRDLLLGLPVKDLDIEVHHLSLPALEKILQMYGPVSVVGKSFGVLRLHGLNIDWSLPRSDSAGRKPTVVVDPQMALEDAFKRRDLTMNAMGIDLATYELIDPWGGYEDLRNKVLHVPDAHLFVQDPLRFFRVMQFIGRFDMMPDAQLDAIAATMDLSDISTERIEAELDKLFLKSKRPSLGIRWIRKIDRLMEIFPELAATIGVPQEPEWHPEGDVFEHTMQALDAAAVLPYENDEQKLIAMYGVLCHDLGKAATTQKIEGRWRSIGHENAGVNLARVMLCRITRRHDLIAAVAKLVRYHMEPGHFVSNGAKAPAYKRLAVKLAPEVTLALLAKVALADKRGRNPVSHEPLTGEVPEITEFLKKAEQLHVAFAPEAPVVQGRDVMELIQPGPAMGELLKRAYDVQLEEGIKDKQTLIKRALQK